MAKTNPRSVKKKSAPQSFQAGGSIGLIIAAIIMIAGIAGIYKWMVIPALENDRAKAPSGLAANGKGGDLKRGDSTSGDQQQKIIKSTGANLDSTMINESGIPINNDAWGQVTTQYPEFYASKDVPKYQIDLTKKYVKSGMTAYVELQEKEFADHDKGYTFSAHQQEVGTGYFDAVNNCIVGDPSTSAMDGSTEEEQF